MSDWTDQHFPRLWDRLSAIYGRRFIDDNGREMNGEWKESVARLSFEQVAYALDICRGAGDAHPINLSLFMARARQRKAHHTVTKSLPSPKPSHDVVAKASQESHKLVASKTSRRKMTLPGETRKMFEAAMEAAIEDGKSRENFMWSRMEANGWTEYDERRIHANAVSIGYRLYDSGVDWGEYLDKR